MSADEKSEVILLRELVATLRSENTLLRQKIDLLIRRVFGSSSERLDPAQLELLLQLSAAPALVEEKTFPENKTSSVSRRKPMARLPDNLPVIEEVIEPEPVKAAPQHWRCIGEEVSDKAEP